MKKFAVIAVGYNRADSMTRLLKSLNNAYYGDDVVDLIISIDNSGTDCVERIGKNFEWLHGNKKVVTYPERQGLRKHILQCGNFLQTYDAVAIFEDDIIASNGFYEYMKATVDKYADDERVAGISLYNHCWNVNADLPFEADYSRYDIYFLQFAQSWGQIWLKRQWMDFVQWYENNCDEFVSQDNIPANVSSWKQTSWLKYHIKYCIEMNKFFVYPYKSLSTCFTDVGEHNNTHVNLYQVPILSGVKELYLLPDIDAEDCVKYDAFFERIFVSKTRIGEISVADICINLYGNKINHENKRYEITTAILPYKKVKSYALEMRPHEVNLIYEMAGQDIHVYDTEYPETTKGVRSSITTNEFYYRYRIRNKSKLMLRSLFDKVLKKFNLKFKGE